MLFTIGLILSAAGFATVKHFGKTVRRVYNLADHIGCSSFWVGAACMASSVLILLWKGLP